MRTDERIEAVFLDTLDVRPLLLAASTRELEPLYRLYGHNLDLDRLAAKIETAIATALPGGNTANTLPRFAAWTAQRLGAAKTGGTLDALDAEVLRLASLKAVPPAPPGGDGALVALGIEISRLRQKKLRRLRWWRPLITLFTPKRTAPTLPVPHTAKAPEVLDAEAAAADTGAGEALWETIKGAAEHLPLGVWEEKLARIRKEIGRFNIIVAGRTGVGKTTLIGAIFGRDVGNTMMGRPRTRGRIWYPEAPTEADVLRLCDTEGLEMDRYAETLDGLKREVEAHNRSHDPFDHIHVAWLCIDEPSLTVQPGEEALIKLLTDEGIPVVVVLTKAGMAPAFKTKVEEILPLACAVIRVRAAPIEIEGQTFGQTGLNELLAATEAAIPNAVEAAWHLASRNLAAMVQRAEATVRAASAAAGAAGATPIPIADAAGVFGIQAGMIVAVSLQMGVKLRRSDLQAMAVTLLGALGLTAGGRILAGLMMKFIPGIGTVTGAAITGTAAAALTYGLGRAYIEYLRTFYSQHDRMPEAGELLSGFRVFWQRWKNKQDNPPPPTHST